MVHLQTDGGVLLVASRSTTEEVLQAWASSALARLPEYARDKMIGGMLMVTVPPRSTVVEAFGAARVGLIISGQARVKVTSRDGREATVRYIGPGQVVGLPAAISQGSPLGADAITECEVALFNVTTVRSLAKTDAAVSWQFAQMMCQIAYEIAEFSSGNLFLPIRQRVSRHLLDLAVKTPDGIFVQVDQQGIADAIGSVREVVARTLRQLKDEGVTERAPGGLKLLDLAALHSIAAG